MPYKSEEARREASRRSMEKKRQGLTKGINKEGLTEQGLTKDGTTGEYIPASYGLPERPRYLKLSDGQILDRTNQPSPNKHLPAMIACNRAYRNTMSQQEMLGRLLVSLKKEVTGLDGKRVSLLGMMRYVVQGPTFKEIKARL